MSAATPDPNGSQREYWNANVGVRWRVHADALDASFAAVTRRILDAAALTPGERVIDVGCGAGATTLAAAHAVGPGGEVIGVDISEPLAALAEERIASAGVRARIVIADAQTAILVDGFDAAISRFGVMFFADAVAAFGNLRHMLRPGGRVAFAAWAAPAANPWFLVPREVAAARFGPSTPPDPQVPGPFAFADPATLAGVLARAGFVEVSVVTERLALAEGTTPSELASLLGEIGPAAGLMDEHGISAADRLAIIAEIAARFERYAPDGGLAVPAEINIATARCP